MDNLYVSAIRPWNPLYDNSCNVHILNEGGNYSVRVEYVEDDTTEIYRFDKRDLLNVLRTLHDAISSKKESVWTRSA